MRTRQKWKGLIMSDNYQAVYDAVRSRFNGCDTSQAIEQAISSVFSNVYVIPEVVRACMADAANEMMRPFMLLRPKVYPDGDQWCALYGDDLQSGVCGFGDTPAKAATQFDIAWLNSTAKNNSYELFPEVMEKLNSLTIRK
jgi:hypothetical protein